jgi:hypothetical protein
LNESYKFDKINPEDLYDIKGFSFNTKIGLDVFEDEDMAYEIIQNVNELIPTSLLKLNVFLGGGLAKKAMTLFLLLREPVVRLRLLVVIWKN